MAMPNVTTQNKYDALNHDESLDDDTMDEEETRQSILKPKRKDRVPIVVSTTELNQIQNQQLRVAVISVAPTVNLKYTKTKLIFYTHTVKEHQTIVQKLNELSTPYYTYQRHEDKLKKMVLKGLPPLNEEDISDSIQDQGLKPIKITRMKTKYDDIPIYQVNFDHETEINNILKIKYVCHVKATWKKYKNPKMLTQCYTCQSFGHGSTHCTNKPKCVKCAGDHLTTNCNVKYEEKEKIKCINCGKNHVASYTGCEKYQQQLKIIQDKRDAATKGQRRTDAPTNNINNYPYMKRNIINQQRLEPTQQQQQQSNKQSYNQVTSNTRNNNNNNISHTSQSPNIHINYLYEINEEIKKLNETLDIKQFLNDLKILNTRITTAQPHERKTIAIEFFLSHVYT